MSRSQRILLSSAALTLLALAGCGGGGGSSGTTPPAPPVNQAPTAAFSLSASTGFAPFTVTLDAGASSDADGSIDSYRWDFDDGSADGAGERITHTFEAPGTYRVELTVTDDDLATASTAQNVDARGARLSGSIQILSSTAVDRDVNDRLTSPASNNSMADAQLLPVPVRLGGFVNLPGTPAEEDANGDVGLGGLYASGDAADYFAVELEGSEAIVLNIGEPDADLDLHLLDAAGTLVDASAGVTATESLVAPGPGSYFVVVFPFDGPSNAAGASNYVLSIGQGLGTAASATSLGADFVPGELIVRPTSTDAADAEAAVGALGKRLSLAGRGRAGRTRLMALAAGARGLDAAGPLPRHGTMAPRQRARYRTLLALKALHRQPEVAAAGLNYRRYPLRTPDDDFYPSQWHYPIINLPAAWDISTGDDRSPGDQVIVAVIDTGILPEHPDLQGQLVAGYDFIRDPATAADGDGIDPDPTDAGDREFAGASSFHGTHVAGTVAAASDNGAGVAGVAWGARIMPIRALGVGGGSTFDVMQGIAFAAGLDNDSGTFPAQPADVINLSLGSTFFSQMEEDFIRDEVVCLDVDPAVDCPRIIVIASAGNENTATPSYPAAYDGVISVAATTISNGRAPYSNFGSTVDVAAPGGNNSTDANGDGIGDGVISTLADDSDPNELLFGYATLTGTSMSAPHVAGVAALMKDVYPALTAGEFEGALVAGLLTDDLGTPGRDDQFGHGLINAQKAVLWALDQFDGSGGALPPILSASVSTLDFGTFTTELDLNVRNVGTGSIDVTPALFGPAPAWLSLTPTGTSTITAGQSTTYTLTVDRSGLPDGDYSQTLRLVPEDPGLGVAELQITVRMRVASAVPDADAGLHYVILVDAEGETALPAVILNVDDGVYDFTIADVPPGSYRMFAGSDMDDDSFLCDGGEACGAYRTLDLPESLDIDAAEQEFVDGLDFVSEFRAVFSATGTGAANADRAIPAEGFRYQRGNAP